MDLKKVANGFWRYGNGEREIVVNEFDHGAIQYGAMRVDWTGNWVSQTPELVVSNYDKMCVYLDLKREEKKRKFAEDMDRWRSQSLAK